MDGPPCLGGSLSFTAVAPAVRLVLTIMSVLTTIFFFLQSKLAPFLSISPARPGRETPGLPFLCHCCCCCWSGSVWFLRSKIGLFFVWRATPKQKKRSSSSASSSSSARPCEKDKRGKRGGKEPDICVLLKKKVCSKHCWLRSLRTYGHSTKQLGSIPKAKLHINLIE